MRSQESHAEHHLREGILSAILPKQTAVFPLSPGRYSKVTLDTQDSE